MIGYQIFYRMLGSVTNHDSVDIAANKKQHTLSNFQGGFVYVITMVTKSQHLPSTVAGPIRATLGKIIQKGRMTFVYIHYLLSPTCFSPAMVSNITMKAANATALLVSWDADSYLSHYTMLLQCLLSTPGKF